MIYNMLISLNVLLAQSQREKELTFIGVSLFCLFLVLLLIDAREGKKWVGDNSILKKIIAAVLAITLVVGIILYFVL